MGEDSTQALSNVIRFDLTLLLSGSQTEFE